MPACLRAVLALTLVAGLTGPTAAQVPVAADVYLPADTENHLTLNVRQLLNSELFKKFGLDSVRDALKQVDVAKEVLDDLGLDPFADIDRVVVAGPGGPETDRGLLIVRGRFDAAKFKAKADAVARDQGDVLKIHKLADGGVIWEVNVPGVDQAFYVALAGNSALLASPGKDYVVDALRAGKAKKPVPLKKKEMQALLAKADPGQTLSLAVLGKTLAKAPGVDDAPPLLKGFLEKVEVIGAGVRVDKDLDIELALGTRTEREARELRETADKGLKAALAGLALLGGDRPELGVALELLKATRVGSRGTVMTLKAKLSAEALADSLRKDD